MVSSCAFARTGSGSAQAARSRRSTDDDLGTRYRSPIDEPNAAPCTASRGDRERPELGNLARRDLDRTPDSAKFPAAQLPNVLEYARKLQKNEEARMHALQQASSAAEIQAIFGGQSYSSSNPRKP